MIASPSSVTSPKRKIVIDARLWSESGIGRYLRNLIKELQLIDKNNQYFILLLKKDFDQIELAENFHKALADFKWYGVDEQIKLPGILKKINPDLVHFPHFNVPILYKGKYIVTIHDLIHRHFQMRRATTHNPLVYKIKTLGYEKTFGAAVFRSKKILVPSNFVKQQLIKEFKIPEDKVNVTYEAADQSLINLVSKVTPADFKKLSEKFNLKKPYLFYVGNAHPHKNINQLVGAFSKIKRDYPDLKLVLSGPDHYFWEQIKKSPIEDVIFTGFVSERELVTLYKNAEVFVTPSLEEGFGIPLLEAMVSGCPVISSDAASLPEVGGDAVIYFDPHQEKDLIDKIEKVLNNRKVKQQLVKKGLERANNFNWRKLAVSTFGAYQEIFSND